LHRTSHATLLLASWLCVGSRTCGPP
jgi:hypothetical protein